MTLTTPTSTLRPRPPAPPGQPARPFSHVETADPGDLDQLIWFLQSVRDEIDGGRAEEDLLLSLASQMVRRDGGVAFIVRSPLGRGIEASMGVVFERPILSRNYYLRSVWNVVAPEARHTTGHAKSLLVAANKFADGIGRRIYIREDAAQFDAPKLRLCGRHLRPAAALFMHEPSLTPMTAALES